MAEDKRDQIQREADADIHQDVEHEARIQERLRKWKKSTALLTVALLICCTAVVPFLAGHSLHDQWNAIGKKLLIACMCLLVAAMYSAGTTYNLWTYLKSIQNIHDRFAPPRARRSRHE